MLNKETSPQKIKETGTNAENPFNSDSDSASLAGSEIRNHKSSNTKKNASGNKQRSNQKKMRPKEKAPTGIHPALIGLVLVVVAGVVIISNSDRITAAKKLVGSTQLPENLGQSIPNQDLSGSGDGQEIITEYYYIDANMLNAMTPTELAIWFYDAFGNGGAINEAEKREFEDWYQKKTQSEPSFASEFQEAMTAIKQGQIPAPSPDEEGQEPNEDSQPTDETQDNPNVICKLINQTLMLREKWENTEKAPEIAFLKA